MPTALTKTLDNGRDYRCGKCDQWIPRGEPHYMVRSRWTSGWCEACVRRFCKVDPAKVPFELFTPWNDG
jgi:hypothetical protein